MYINEVVRRVKNYCPSEYDENEMYVWCDEVSAMLLIEDRNMLVKAVLKPDKNGTVLLPRDVKFENIISVVCDGRTLNKKELNLNECKSCNSSVELLYIEPYEPIRVAVYRGDAAIADSSIEVNDCPFKVGDCLEITVDNNEFTVNVTDIKQNDSKYLIYFSGGNIQDTYETQDIHIKRIITEKTVCDAPYDGMYVDYILAKIAMYQHDFYTYNQFMTSFNSMLDAYKRWITDHMPQREGTLKNWW